MKVFISWSGPASHEVALTLKDWLPSVIQTIEPYVSSEDIAKGDRWSTEVAKELDATSFGIICVTKENTCAPWLLFEAGALSNRITNARVCPFLFDLKPSELKGPLEQFQMTEYQRGDVRKLLESINKELGSLSIDEERLARSFEKWWPDFESRLNKLKENRASETEKEAEDKPDPGYEVLEMLLEIARSNQRLLRSPEQLFPTEYFLSLVEKINQDRIMTDEGVQLLSSATILVRQLVSEWANIQRANDAEGKEGLGLYKLSSLFSDKLIELQRLLYHLNHILH